jgi:hypothetical protein
MAELFENRENGQISVAKSSMIVITMAEAKQPVFKAVSSKKWIPYGDKDDYPDYLLDNFNKSPKHNAIIKGKVNYTLGQGWFKGKTEYTEAINDEGETLMQLSDKCALDLEIFGGFYLEIIRTKGGKFVYHHVDYRKVRSNEDNSQYWYKKDGNWESKRIEPVEVAAYDPNKVQSRCFFYYKEYRPGVNTYTLPSYVAAMNYIEADVEVSKHTLGNAKTGFTPSKMITLPNGEPSDDQKKVIEWKFRNKFTGSDGQKFILSFVNSAEKKPIIDDLGASDLTKEDFTVIDGIIQQNIFVGHQVTSPMLFGIKTEGQLGGRDEIRTAYQIFQNTYINGRQQQLEAFFNYFLNLGLEIHKTEPISFEFGETVMSNNMMTDEIRKVLGLEPLDKTGIDKAMSGVFERLKLSNPRLADRLVQVMTDDEIRGMIGLNPKPADPTIGQEQTPAKFSRWEEMDSIGSLWEDYFIVKETGRFSSQIEALEHEVNFFKFAQDVAILTPTEESIISVLRKDPKISPEMLARKLGILQEKVDAVIKSLVSRNYLSEEVAPSGIGGGSVISRTPSDKLPPINKAREITIKYSYEHRTDVPPLVPGSVGSRPFCKKMESLNRLYTRKDIEQLSSLMGYDVWTHCGGWYHNPVTKENEDQCRHQWVGHVVVKQM